MGQLSGADTSWLQSCSAGTRPPLAARGNSADDIYTPGGVEKRKGQKIDGSFPAYPMSVTGPSSALGFCSPGLFPAK